MVVGKLEERRLEVVVLGARSLPESSGEGRRKVQLSVITAEDPEGQLFGVKASPWTEPVSSSRSVRFGRSGQGLTCSFVLSGSSAPGATADPRFADKARLRARLLCSRVPMNAAFKTVTGMLPTNFASGMAEELDEATALVEAETLVPLANIISGRIGFHADRAMGGWVPLIPTDKDAIGFDAGMDSDRPPMSIWMQMYVLPDHEKMLPDIQGQFAEELQNGRKGPTPKVGAPMASPSPSGKGFAQVAASVGAQPRWGPKRPAGSSPVPAAAGAEAPAAVDLLGFEEKTVSGGGNAAEEDLLDFGGGSACTTTATGGPPFSRAGNSDLLGVGGGSNGGTELLFEASSPSQPPICSSSLTSNAAADLLESAGAGADAINLLESSSYDASLLSLGKSAQPPLSQPPSLSAFPGAFANPASQSPSPLFSGLTTASMSSTLPATAAAAPVTKAAVSGSAFSFISSPSASSASAAAVPAQVASPAPASSAFSFISQSQSPSSTSAGANVSPSAGVATSGLDLKALYEASGPAPAERRQETSNYSALSDFDLRISMQQSSPSPGTGAGLGGRSQQKPIASSLQGLEANLVAGLSSSLRS